MYLIRIILIGLMFRVKLVATEMRFVCPRPQHPRSTSSKYPCGSDGFSKEFEADYMEVKPGPLTIHFEETVFRADSPAKINLREFGDAMRSCVLLDHIPHNNAVMVNRSRTDCKVDNYPLGKCGSSSFITINIPNVECHRCFLQLVAVQTDESNNGVPCFVSDDGISNCTTSYSCANIKIRSTEASKGMGMETCQRYTDNLGGRWPFVQKSVFKASLGGSPFSDGHVLFEMDHTNFLKYDISLGNTVPVPGRDEIFIVMYNGGASYSRLQFIPVAGPNLKGELGAFDHSLKALLSTNQLALEIRRSTGQSLFRNITRVSVKYKKHTYLAEGMNYTPTGWLKGPDFVGPEAPHPQAVYPSGICAPSPPHYGSILRDENGTIRALVSYGVVVGEQLLLEAVIISLKGSAREIIFSRQGETLTTFPGEYITRNYAHGNTPYKQQEVPDSVAAFIQVNGSYIDVSSEPFKAVKALLTDQDDLHTALGITRLLDNGLLEFTVAILNKTGDRNVGAQVWIKGPRPTNTSTEQFAVPVRRTESTDIGGWVGHTVVTVKDSYVAHCLRLGVISLEITFTNQAPLSAQFDPIDDWFCDGSSAVVCLVCEFSDQGGSVNKGLSVLNPNGFATFYMTSEKALQFSITVRDLRQAEEVTSVELRTSREVVKDVHGSAFSTSRHVSKAVESQGFVQLSDENIKELASGRMVIVVFTTQSTSGEIHGTLPKIGGTQSYSAANVRSTGLQPKISSQVKGLILGWMFIIFSGLEK